MSELIAPPPKFWAVGILWGNFLLACKFSSKMQNLGWKPHGGEI